jgi:hypothetical protein
MAYLTLEQFKALTVMPASYVDAIDAAAPGWLAAQLEYWSDWINARLRKRYGAPFAEPYPGAVTGWLQRIVTEQAWLKRGVDAQDQQFERISNSADEAKKEVLEAADSSVGLFDLPLRDDSTASGIRPDGFVYSEQSPYVFQDEQARTGQVEDRNRRGTGG